MCTTQQPVRPTTLDRINNRSDVGRYLNMI
jgi:hypothetical protein